MPDGDSRALVFRIRSDRRAPRFLLPLRLERHNNHRFAGFRIYRPLLRHSRNDPIVGDLAFYRDRLVTGVTGAHVSNQRVAREHKLLVCLEVGTELCRCGFRAASAGNLAAGVVHNFGSDREALIRRDERTDFVAFGRLRSVGRETDMRFAFRVGDEIALTIGCVRIAPVARIRWL